jgi:hypothetical protein
MLKRTAIPLTSLLLLALLWASCQKTEQLATAKITDYQPLQIGKYITYRIDSTVYTTLSSVREVHSYIIQDFVDAEVTDNLGRPAYRIRRMIRDNADTTKWTDNTSYIIIPLAHSVEVVDNNLRYIKLQEPIRETATWKGNNYINTFSDPSQQYLDDWDYTFENVEQPFSLGKLNWDQSITVNQRDEVLGTPDNRQFYWEINRSKEVYAKGIGLVYKDFLHEAWQPSNIICPAGCFESNGYGIRLTFLNSNY